MQITEKKCPLKPSADKVLIRLNKIDNKSKGGVYLPDNRKVDQSRGRVVAKGDGRMGPDGKTRIPIEFNVGDDVVFWPGAASQIEVDGEKMMMVQEMEILGTYEEEV